MAIRTPHEPGDNEEEAEVECILEHRITEWEAGERWDYQVKWNGWPDPTWEPDTALDNAPKVVRDYWQKHGGMPVRKRATHVSTRRVSHSPHSYVLACINVYQAPSPSLSDMVAEETDYEDEDDVSDAIISSDEDTDGEQAIQDVGKRKQSRKAKVITQ
jgi:hypothetical protein